MSELLTPYITIEPTTITFTIDLIIAALTSVLIPQIPHISRRKLEPFLLVGTDIKEEEIKKKHQQEDQVGAPTSDD